MDPGFVGPGEGPDGPDLVNCPSHNENELSRSIIM
jgi:hypothetical protein